MSAVAGDHQVLLTGSRGFTGQYVRALLERDGWHVHGVVHGEAAGPDESACDLTDAAAVTALVDALRPTHVVHLAGLAFVGDADAEAFYRVNVLGTTNLLAALGRHAGTVRKVVIASSANVYGRPAVENVDESLCSAPVNHYGCSKLAMEHMAATWFERLPIVITRPFNYTGPGQDERFLVPKIAAHFARRAPFIELGNLNVSRDFSDVRDVAEVYRRLLVSVSHSTRVNICSAQPRSLQSIVDACAAITGHRLEVRVNPAFVRASEIPVLAGDAGRLERVVGPRERTPFEQTLSDLCQSLAGRDPAAGDE